MKAVNILYFFFLPQAYFTSFYEHILKSLHSHHFAIRDGNK
jgi:hypothetical protein